LLPASQNEKLVMLGNLLAAMEETGFTSITNVDLSDRLNIQIVYENRILLKLGVEADLAHKLETVRHLVEEKLGPEERGTLDVSEVSKWTIFSSDYGESMTLDPEGETVANEPTEEDPPDQIEPEEGEEEPDPTEYSENPV
jgi:isopenicillin N synthase-like dioxygenase